MNQSLVIGAGLGLGVVCCAYTAARPRSYFDDLILLITASWTTCSGYRFTVKQLSLMFAAVCRKMNVAVNKG